MGLVQTVGMGIAPGSRSVSRFPVHPKDALMIVYSLRCTCDHEFDEWFDNMADYERRKADGTLACPSCGGHQVSKAIMAPRVGKTADSRPAPPCGAPSCGNPGGCPMMGMG